jgi:hypothetical protein
MLAGAPKGGFTDFARVVRDETESLSKKWDSSMDATKLAVIVDFLERLGQLQSGGEVEPGLAGRLVEEARGEGHFHDCAWALSQYFAELATGSWSKDVN